MKLRHTLAVVVWGAVVLTSASVGAQESPKAAPPAGAVAPANPGAPAAGRSEDQITADLKQTGEELRQAMGASPDVLFDPAKRNETAVKAVPALKRMTALLGELAAAVPQQKDRAENARLEFTTLLTLFGDAEASAALDALAKAEGPQGLRARTSRHLVSYWRAAKDEAAQNKVLDELQKIAKASPKEDAVAQALMTAANMGAASKAVADRAKAIVRDDLTGEMATMIKAEEKQAAEQAAADQKLKDMVGKPIDIKGARLDGKAFSTADWKGKVILVDFWATWCGPCIREMPKVKKAYIDHHAKGLEILGVSCDNDPAALVEFLGRLQNKDMPWPQLFDAKENPKLEWHPIAKGFGINGIPTMFLIDRKGVLRSIDARADFEEMIPKLLEEKAE